MTDAPEPTDTETDDRPDRLPERVADEAERLTRRAREAEAATPLADADSHPTAAELAATAAEEATAAREERDALLAEHGYTARERVDSGSRRDAEGGTRGVTLVCYPEEWLEDGTVRFDRIDETSRAVERPLDAPAEEADWESVDERNREVAAAVEDAHGPIHGANARAFADFMSNHYAAPIGAATRRMREEFLTEYFPRNAWPTDEQRSLVEESVNVAVETARD
ncbi:DUF7108 family protein [Halomarina litorea]|uniref:DUF7108 family protein n=1 Tax=Halomarina litorea TaxID=2961595 RepID=UPI0020C3D0E2|nr:rnhA operon protein [Halomarina sp. BCD28]